jgi:hypothetical protein
MAFELSTAGIKFYCLLAAPADSPPASGWELIPSVKSVPDYDDAPDLLQTTDLAQLEYHTYVPGLRALNEPYDLTANMTNEVITFWKNKVDAYKQVNTTQKLWITCIIPGLDKAPFLYGTPFSIGIPPMEVDSVLEITLTVIPEKIIGYFPKINAGGEFTTPVTIESLTNQNSTYTIGDAITGAATTGATVTAYVDGTAISPTAIAVDSAWSITPETALSAGVHYINAKQELDGSTSDLTQPLLINAVTA